MTPTQIRDQWSLGFFGGMLLGWATGFVPSIMSRSLRLTYLAYSVAAFSALTIIAVGYSRLRVLHKPGIVPSMPVVAIGMALSIAMGVVTLAPFIIGQF
jgi:hypothetical protein